MADLIQLDDFRPHIEGSAKCLQCNHEWHASALAGTVYLQCPKCNLHKGAFIGGCLNSEQPIYQCHCGNNLFAVQGEYFICSLCGIKQEFE